MNLDCRCMAPQCNQVTKVGAYPLAGKELCRDCFEKEQNRLLRDDSQRRQKPRNDYDWDQ